MFPRSGNRPFLVVLASILLACGPASAAFKTWTASDPDREVEAELISFDFDSKELVARDREDEEIRLATADLDFKSRMQLLLSPKFVQSYPSESWTPEQGRFVLFAIGAPSLFLLASFYLCSALLLKKFNPLRAMVGWIGTLILGAFLISCYVALSARAPEAAMGIAIFGFVVVTGLLGFFIGIVYDTSTTNGLKVLILHLFGALVLILLTVVIVGNTADPASLEAFFNRLVFAPVGLLGEG